MSGWKKLAAASAASSVILPESTSFGGSSSGDYLGRSSDLTGNADGKTFTFSAWIYEAVGDSKIYHIDSGGGGTRFQIAVDGQGTGAMLRILAVAGASNTTSLYVRDAGHFPVHTWTHVLCSFDMENTSNRYIYINDIQQSVTYDDYLNNNLDFTSASFLSVGAGVYSGGPYGIVEGRLAHVYLDYTYRNLSTTSNRRLFITSDLKPADNQSSLSPIIYLPMTDFSTAGTNEGTGGNFTVNGTLAKGLRGPNQNNCSASEFDGSNDYMTKTLTQTDTSVLTCSFFFKQDGTNAVGFRTHSGSTIYVEVQNANYANAFRVILRDTSGSQICNLESSFRISQGASASVQVSVDISNSGARLVKMFLNGVEDTSITKTFYNSSTTYRLASDAYLNRDKNGTEYFDGSMGEFYFDTAYIDLSSNNPFWDADANLPKPVRQVLEETGNTPLIAMPMNAHNPGFNLGTAGDFTVESGPYSGARNGSEFFCRSLNFNNPSFNQGKYLKLDNANETGINKVTLAISFKRDNTNCSDNICLFNVNSTSGNNYQFSLIFDSGENLLCFFNGHQVSNLGTVTNQNWHTVLISVDSTTTTAYAYLDGVSKSASITTNRTFSQAFTNVGGGFPSTQGFEFDGELAFVYQSHTYVDFSSEANRNLFVSQMNYPINLSTSITSGDIATPKVYLKFEDKSDFGKNDGTYGDFTDETDSVNGPDVGPY